MSTFSLAGKGLKLDTAEDITKHLQPLVDNDNVTHIDLSGNTLGVGACEALSPILKTKKSLQSIDLHDIFTGRMVTEIPPAVDALLTALLECPLLETVDLNDNAFGLKTRDPLVDFLSKHLPLRHLILNNNGMGPIAGESIANALTILAEKKAAARAEGKNVPHLESVVCGRNRLENGSMQAWARAYSAHKEGLKSIRMIQNGIRPEGTTLLITEGLSKCANLEVFDLQDNTFTATGAQALAKAILGWHKLKELGVGDGFLQAKGSSKVFNALAQGNNKAIEHLRLEFNDITPSGLKELLRAARVGLPSLRRVDLNGNKFDEEDSSLIDLGALLEERKEQRGTSTDPADYWGLGDLDELEGEDSDEENEEEEEEEEERETVLKDADEAESAEVSQKRDAEVDELADALEKTEV